VIIGGDQVAQGKPAPDPYLKAASELGIHVGHCLALEDSDNGAMSAYSAGIPVIVIPDIKPPSNKTQEIALNIYESLHEVIHYLQAGGFLPEVKDDKH
jgi:beta-phosphoglucomutase-like phosphatase (HAD superfamily)